MTSHRDSDKNGLRRKVPLKRTPFVRKTPIARKKSLEGAGRIRQRSAKLAKLYRNERVPLVVRILAERQLCEVGPRLRAVMPDYRDCTLVSTCVHEMRKCSQSSRARLDEENCLASCYPCNSAIEDHPIAAHEAGVVRRAGE